MLRDLALFPDRLDPAASVDEALVTLLPGESTTFTVATDAPLDPAALTTRPVLRCVNESEGPFPTPPTAGAHLVRDVAVRRRGTPQDPAYRCLRRREGAHHVRDDVAVTRRRDAAVSRAVESAHGPMIVLDL